MCVSVGGSLQGLPVGEACLAVRQVEALAKRLDLVVLQGCMVLEVTAERVHQVLVQAVELPVAQRRKQLCDVAVR